MSRLIYIETTIPSFYFETRVEPEILARHNWTVEWWDAPDLWAERVTSRVVIEELERTPEPKRQRCLDLVASLKLLPYTSEVDEIVQTYRQHKVMPIEASGDADHLAPRHLSRLRYGGNLELPAYCKRE